MAARKQPVRIMCWGFAFASSAKPTKAAKAKARAKVLTDKHKCCGKWDAAVKLHNPGPFLRQWCDSEYPGWLNKREGDILESWNIRELKKLIRAVRRLCRSQSMQGPILLRTQCNKKAMVFKSEPGLVVAVFLHPEFRK